MKCKIGWPKNGKTTSDDNEATTLAINTKTDWNGEVITRVYPCCEVHKAELVFLESKGTMYGRSPDGKVLYLTRWEVYKTLDDVTTEKA